MRKKICMELSLQAGQNFNSGMEHCHVNLELFGDELTDILPKEGTIWFCSIWIIPFL